MTETVEKCRARVFPAALAGHWLNISRLYGDLPDGGDFWGKVHRSPGRKAAETTSAEQAGR